MERLKGAVRAQVAHASQLQEQLIQAREGGAQSVELPIPAAPAPLPFTAEAVQLAESSDAEHVQLNLSSAQDDTHTAPGDSAVKAAAFEDPDAPQFDWDLLSVAESPKGVAPSGTGAPSRGPSDDGIANLVDF